MSETWASWEGQTVGLFPLRRYLGSSDHSAVYLAESAAGGLPGQVALKLVPAISTLAESQLSDWNNVAGLAHPHLIRLLRTGQCELGGLPYLYAVMEYADQSLAQVLAQRALTDDEAREMLLPTLSALAYLHDRNLVHRQLKPANILAVGDQLKLASDTIRRVNEADAGRNAPSVYDPPEAHEGSYSIAGDVWALGVSLFEALTRSPRPGFDEGRGSVELPRDFSPAFREIVARCLSRRASDRPTVTEIAAWVRRPSAGSPPIVAPQPAAAGPITPDSVPLQPAAPVQVAHNAPPAAPKRPQAAAPGQVARATAPASPKMPQPTAARTAAPVAARTAAPVAARTAAPVAARTAAPAAARTAAPAAAAPQAVAPRRAPSAATVSEPALRSAHRPVVHGLNGDAAWQQLWKRPFVVPMLVGALVVLALSWAGVRALRTHRNPTPAAVQAHPDTALPTPSQATTMVPNKPSTSPVSSGVITRSVAVQAAASLAAVHEEIPNVPPRARRTIHGHIRVSVRVMVDQDGTVFAALVDQPGPSRYFRRLAIEAAKKWTFPPADKPDTGQRLESVRFVFTRQGTTGHAVTLQ